MSWKRVLLAGIVVGLVPAMASAQRSAGGAPGSTGMHRFEITPFVGYSWTFSREFYYGLTAGRVDIEDSAMWGIALDINLPQSPGSQIELLYNRQDSKVTFTSLTGPSGLLSVEDDFAVEYWHVGGIYGIPRGRALPFTMLTLGGTRYISEGLGEDNWKFSIIFGLGAKLYASDRIGLKLQGRFPFSIFSSGGAVGCGSGGCYTSIGGSGLGQFDLSAGVMLLM